MRVSNYTNAWEKLKLHIPKFLQYELTRPLPRDILENGKGVGNDEDLVSKLSRSDMFLPTRIKRNSYPIILEDGDRLQCRYMRHWIETGHQKAGLPLSPLLTIAMDFFDEALDKECIFNECLQRGDMIFTNNRLVAHARNSFKDDPTGEYPPRHMVRAWIQFPSKKDSYF